MAAKSIISPFEVLVASWIAQISHVFGREDVTTTSDQQPPDCTTVIELGSVFLVAVDEGR